MRIFTRHWFVILLTIFFGTTTNASHLLHPEERQIIIPTRGQYLVKFLNDEKAFLCSKNSSEVVNHHDHAILNVKPREISGFRANDLAFTSTLITATIDDELFCLVAKDRMGTHTNTYCDFWSKCDVNESLLGSLKRELFEATSSTIDMRGKEAGFINNSWFFHNSFINDRSGQRFFFLHAMYNFSPPERDLLASMHGLQRSIAFNNYVAVEACSRRGQGLPAYARKTDCIWVRWHELASIQRNLRRFKSYDVRVLTLGNEQQPSFKLLSFSTDFLRNIEKIENLRRLNGIEKFF